MRLHRNAKLGLPGRYSLAMMVERGCSLREAAVAAEGIQSRRLMSDYAWSYTKNLCRQDS